MKRRRVAVCIGEVGTALSTQDRSEDGGAVTHEGGQCTVAGCPQHVAVEDVKEVLLQVLTDIAGPSRRRLHEIVEVVRDVKTRRGQHPRDK